MQALFLYADRLPTPDHPGELNTSRFRCWIPEKYLSKAGQSIELRHIDEAFREQSVPDVVLAERKVSSDLIDFLRRMGAKRIIITFDDNYRLIPNVSSAHTYWKQPGRLADFSKALSKADRVIVPSQQLLYDFIKDNRSIQIVENFHDPEDWSFTGNLRQSSRILIGYGGSLQHIATFQKLNMAQAIQQVLDLRENVFFQSTGLEIVKHRRAETLNWLPTLREWNQRVASFDIGIAPLAGEYDMRRSRLRLTEYGLARVPFVASSLGSYVYGSNEGGLWVRNNDSQRNWTDTILKLVDNPSLRVDLAHDGHEWAKNFFMPSAVSMYEELLWGNL